jgi:agmatinase
MAGVDAQAGRRCRAGRWQGLRGRPLYLTVDLDWFDPAVLPGTGTPEPGGFLWADFAELVAELSHHRLVGADIVELSPHLDPSGVSSVLAAKVTRSLLLLLGTGQPTSAR